MFTVGSKVVVLLLLIIIDCCSHFACIFCVFGPCFVLIQLSVLSSVLPAKSDIDAMFVYKVIRDLESIDHLNINPIL